MNSHAVKSGKYRVTLSIHFVIRINDNIRINNITALEEKGLVRPVSLLRNTTASTINNQPNSTALTTAFENLIDGRENQWFLIKLVLGKAAVSAI